MTAPKQASPEWWRVRRFPGWHSVAHFYDSLGRLHTRRLSADLRATEAEAVADGEASGLPRWPSQTRGKHAMKLDEMSRCPICEHQLKPIKAEHVAWRGNGSRRHIVDVHRRLYACFGCKVVVRLQQMPDVWKPA